LCSYALATADLALEQAEAETTRGEIKGPLHGAPIAVKDLCWTKGSPKPAGCRRAQVAVGRGSAAASDRQSGLVKHGKAPAVGRGAGFADRIRSRELREALDAAGKFVRLTSHGSDPAALRRHGAADASWFACGRFAVLLGARFSKVLWLPGLRHTDAR
jgi:hypothetical protein